MSFNHCLLVVYLYARQIDVLGVTQYFASPSGLRHVDVNSRLLAGEEEQSELAVGTIVGAMTAQASKPDLHQWPLYSGLGLQKV